MSQWMPGYRFQYQVPPKSPPFSITRIDSHARLPQPCGGEQAAEPATDDHRVDPVQQRLRG